MNYINRLLFLVILSSLSGCNLFTDRTTVVYGTITDQNGEPVDSILVSIDGARAFKYETLIQVYTGKDGSYELAVEIPRKFSSASLIVPFGSYDNPKFQKNYKGKKTFKNDQFTTGCCSVLIGDRTKYDFELIPK